MSWEALAWAKQQKGLGAQGKLLLILLAEKAGSTHSCYPSVSRLAEEMEVSERTVQRLLAKFEADNLIKRWPRKRRTTVYTMVMNGINQTEADNVVTEEDDQVEMGDSVSPMGDNAPGMGDKSAVMGDNQTVTPGVTPCVSPEHQKNTTTEEKNKNTASGGSELALADVDGSLWLVRGEQVEITAQVCVAAWVDAIRENGTEPTKAQIGRVARMCKELLEKNDGSRVLQAASDAGSYGNAAVDSAMTIAAGRPFRARRETKDDRIKKMLQHANDLEVGKELNPWG